MGRLNIPLLADTSKKISASYGVLVTDENDDMFGAGSSEVAKQSTFSSIIPS